MAGEELEIMLSPLHSIRERTNVPTTELEKLVMEYPSTTNTVQAKAAKTMPSVLFLFQTAQVLTMKIPAQI